VNSKPLYYKNTGKKIDVHLQELTNAIIFTIMLIYFTLLYFTFLSSTQSEFSGMYNMTDSKHMIMPFQLK